MKSSVYRNVGVTASCLGLLVALVGCFGMSVSFESTNPDISSQQPTETTQWETTYSTPVLPEKGISASLSTPAITPTNQVEHSSKQNTHPVYKSLYKLIKLTIGENTIIHVNSH